MKLTQKAIDSLTFAGKTPKHADVRWDDALANFGARVWPSGEVTFVVRFRVDGRKRYLTLGRYGVLTLDEARNLARKRLSEVLHGSDPAEEKQRRLGAKTFGDLEHAYLEDHAKVRKKSWKDDEQRLRKYVPNAWRLRKAEDVEYRDVARLHRDIGKTQPTTANRVVAILSKMYALAPKWGYVPKGFANPCKGVEKFDEVKRDRFVRPDELPALVTVIDREPEPFRQLWWLYLLTGLRRDELRTLRWDDIDFGRGEIRLAETKAGRPHYLPLSEQAKELLEGLPRWATNPYVFAGRRAGQPIIDVNHRWSRLRAEATKEIRKTDRTAIGFDDVRIHDLRRTLGSWMAHSGASLALIGRVLNHSNQSTTAIYARFHSDPVKTALNEHSLRLIEASVLPVPADASSD